MGAVWGEGVDHRYILLVTDKVNGMVGDIAEGKVDMGIGPFTITADRSEVIRFSIGNMEYQKAFFLSTNGAKSFNLGLFVEPFAFETWCAVVAVMILTSVTLRIAIEAAKDQQLNEFSLRKCFTFSISGISFARRWSVTPSSIPGRITFITILISGVLILVSI